MKDGKGGKEGERSEGTEREERRRGGKGKGPPRVGSHPHVRNSEKYPGLTCTQKLT